ncbi:MAG: preprotein translocase subunit YajC [Clostridiales bacterium GWF2_38_85]|nr:MAG: preprotein translocase subunit YajC [Clostridiales bacterium GWF2_38_85]HBL85513.1 preprotein translocase subunit YajC [Clostridiales bacterium]
MNPIGLFLAATESPSLGGLGDWTMIILLGAMFIFLYFFTIRPQKKKEKQVAEMRKSVMVGDKVTTNGGIVGTVLKDTDETLFLLSGTQKIEVYRWAIRSIDKKVDSDETEEDK